MADVDLPPVELLPVEIRAMREICQIKVWFRKFLPDFIKNGWF